MFDQPDMPDAKFIEEMDALIPDMYDPPGGFSPPTDPKDGSLPASHDDGGAQGAPGSTQSAGEPSGKAAAAAAQHDTAKPVWMRASVAPTPHSPDAIAKNN